MTSIYGNPTQPGNQQGWVLVVGLVILFMLTILSMALMKTTRLEEKMAGATRDMNLSFQAAATALREAENLIEAQTLESVFLLFNTKLEDEIYSQTEDEPEGLFTLDWDDTNSEAINGTFMGVTTSPRYMIKKLKKVGGSNLTITGYGDDDATPRPTIFRVTVRGTGGTNNRATLLRSHYSKAF